MWYVQEMQGGFPTSIPLFDAVLLALASMRITRLLVYDKITKFFREFFVDKKVVERDGVKFVEITPLTRGIRATIYDLLNCPWCIGIWSSLVVTFCYFVFPWAWYILLFLALAGAGTFLQILSNMIGWRAENLKLDAKLKEQSSRI